MAFSEADIVLPFLFDSSGARDEWPLPGRGIRRRDDRNWPTAGSSPTERFPATAVLWTQTTALQT